MHITKKIAKTPVKGTLAFSSVKASVKRSVKKRVKRAQVDPDEILR